MSTGPAGIAALGRLVADLPAGDRDRFERIFQIDITAGETRPPEVMHPWLERHFGSADAVCQQRIVKVTNRWTLEGALFNEMRPSRPFDATRGSVSLDGTIAATAGDPSCFPEEGTPADVFGRIRSQHAITAANVAKFDGWHAVIIFRQHHPLRFSCEQVADYVETGQAWAGKAHEFAFRLLERGGGESNTSDLGAMEIFGQNVVSTDPYHVAARLVQAGEPAG